MASFPQIIVGTYEEFVLGYKPKTDTEKTQIVKLVQTFATHTHQASVRCIAAHGQLMASSGADEYINIYDMNAMEVTTVINYHNATVTCLEFTTDGSHLVTANQNGDIAIFRCRDWNLVKLWKEAHKHANGVTSISIHPSGTLLMTTGADNIVRFWNLVKGRQAYAVNFSKKCSVGKLLNFGVWSSKGDYYVISIGNKVEVYKTETAALIYEVESKCKISSSAFTKKNLLCIGTEEGCLEVHSLAKKKVFVKVTGHKTRIKSICYFSLSVIKNEKNKLENYIVTTDSKGCLKLWSLKKKGTDYSLETKGEVDCDCRITCLTTVFPKNVKEEKEDFKETESLNNSNEISLEHQNGNDNSSIISSKKKKKKKVKENSNISQLNGSSEKEIPCSNYVKEDTIANSKKRKLVQMTSIPKKSKLISSTPKQRKKKKFSKSPTSEKIEFKRTSGKWSVE